MHPVYKFPVIVDSDNDFHCKWSTFVGGHVQSKLYKNGNLVEEFNNSNIPNPEDLIMVLGKWSPFKQSLSIQWEAIIHEIPEIKPEASIVEEPDNQILSSLDT